MTAARIVSVPVDVRFEQQVDPRYIVRLMDDTSGSSAFCPPGSRNVHLLTVEPSTDGDRVVCVRCGAAF